MAEHGADARRRTVSWDDPVRAIHLGSRLATAEARLTDGAGKLYAHAVGTCLVLAAR